MDQPPPDSVRHAERLGHADAAGPMVMASRIWQIGSLLTSYVTSRIDVDGLQLGEAEVLMATRVRDGQMTTPGDLRTQLNLTSAGITKRIDQVEARGLIERRPHPTDRRSVTLHLTEEGEALADRTIVAVAQAMADLTADSLPGDEIAHDHRVHFHVPDGGIVCTACSLRLEGVIPVALGTMRHRLRQSADTKVVAAKLDARK